MGARFQDRVWEWMRECFGSVIPGDKIERGDRLIEEVLELLQAASYPEERVDALKRYVYDRPIGELFQEAGGVMVTLAAFSQAHDIDMAEAGETELERVRAKIEQIRTKQAAKPVGAALPIPAATSNANVGLLSKAFRDVIAERRRQIDVEGFDEGHDDQHRDGTLALAGIAYALPTPEANSLHGSGVRLWRVLWPWEGEWFKRKDRRSDLVRGATLIIAEIEHLDRAASKAGGA